MEIGELIGATSSFEFRKNSVVLKFSKQGKKIQRKIRNLSRRRVKDLSYLGKAWGMDLGHCFYLGSKFCKDFVGRIRGYKVVPSDKKGCNLAVMFYGRKNK